MLSICVFVGATKTMVLPTVVAVACCVAVAFAGVAVVVTKVVILGDDGCGGQ